MAARAAGLPARLPLPLKTAGTSTWPSKCGLLCEVCGNRQQRRLPARTESRRRTRQNVTCAAGDGGCSSSAAACLRRPLLQNELGLVSKQVATWTSCSRNPGSSGERLSLADYLKANRSCLQGPFQHLCWLLSNPNPVAKLAGLDTRRIKNIRIPQKKSGTARNAKNVPASKGPSTSGRAASSTVHRHWPRAERSLRKSRTPRYLR